MGRKVRFSKPVDADEVKEAVLQMLVERFDGRPHNWETFEKLDPNFGPIQNYSAFGYAWRQG
jgi:hypothetical protein